MIDENEDYYFQMNSPEDIFLMHEGGNEDHIIMEDASYLVQQVFKATCKLIKEEYPDCTDLGEKAYLDKLFKDLSSFL